MHEKGAPDKIKDAKRKHTRGGNREEYRETVLARTDNGYESQNPSGVKSGEEYEKQN